MTTPADPDTIKALLEDEIATIECPECAEQVVDRIEQQAHGTEASRGDAAAQTQPTHAIQHAAATSATPVASTLVETAAQAVALTPHAEAVVSAAQATMAPRSTNVRPETLRGRRFLREAAIKRMGHFQSLDARLYLLLNGSPHPPVLDFLGRAIAVTTVSGLAWDVGTFVAYLLRVPRARVALQLLLPSVTVATWIVEFPVKRFFRRRRPFITIVRALVIGRRPGSWSFPSGHSAASFAAARVLSTVWPARSPLFYAGAITVGISRVYVGDHYPGDVLSGAVLGTIFSEIVRRLVGCLIRPRASGPRR